VTLSHGHRTGRAGEFVALLRLVVGGYRIRHRNWRHGRVELDIVAERRGTVIFVEVKTRSGTDFGGAAAAVDARKREHVVRCAAAYLSREGLWERPTRFDVITVEPGLLGLPLKVSHYTDAFQSDLGRSM
jgi:putative endonuclease